MLRYDRNRSGRRGRNRKQPSYFDKLRSGEKRLSNASDAKQVFRLLSRDYGNPTRLALNFDDAMVRVLKEATELLHPYPTEPLRLLEALGDEVVTQGVYRDRTLACFEGLYEAEGFFSNLALKLSEDLLVASTSHSTIAWFLL